MLSKLIDMLKKKRQRKIALTTVINDGFLKGGIVSLHSFLKHNPWFNGDIIVFHSKNVSYLSDKSVNELKRFFPKIILYEIDEEDYSNIEKSKALNNRFIVSYFTLEAFRIEGYDKVFFLDADVLVQGDMKPFFEKDLFVGVRNSLIVNSDEHLIIGHKKPRYINGGIFCIPGKICGERLYKKMLSIAKPGWKKCDQDTINKWLETQKYFVISNTYNCMVRGLVKNEKDPTTLSVNAVHYAGKYKPWFYNEESPYYNWEKLWTDYYESIVNNSSR